MGESSTNKRAKPRMIVTPSERQLDEQIQPLPSYYPDRSRQPRCGKCQGTTHATWVTRDIWTWACLACGWEGEDFRFLQKDEAWR